MTRLKMLGILVVIPALAGNGCIVVGISWSGPSVWEQGATQRIDLDAANLSALEVRTHNGAIAFTGQSGSADAFVDVTKKGGGRTSEDALAALAAIDVYVEPAGAGSQRIGWRWKGLKGLTWRGQVSFDIHAPSNLNLSARTHNGSVTVKGVSGDAHLVTHNGQIAVESSTGTLYAETHNGGVNADYSGGDITLKTRNGQIVVDLSRCSAVGGSVTTRNGGVELIVGDKTSAKLNCTTRNGRIRCGVPLKEVDVTRHHLTGTIGTGDGNLKLTTRNGSVRIKKAG